MARNWLGRRSATTKASASGPTPMTAPIIRSRAKPVSRDIAVKPPTERKLRYMSKSRITEGGAGDAPSHHGALTANNGFLAAPAGSHPFARHWRRRAPQVKNLGARSRAASRAPIDEIEVAEKTRCQSQKRRSLANRR